MSLERNQESEPDTRASVVSEQLASSAQRRRTFSRPPSAPPPYEQPSTSNVSGHPPLPPRSPARATSPTPHQLGNPPEAISRRLPTPPDPRVVTVTPVEEDTMANSIRLDLPSQTAPPSLHPSSSPTSSPSSSPQALTSSQSPQSHVNNPSQPLPLPPYAQPSKSRSVFRPFTVLKLPKVTRNATAQIASQAAWKINQDLRLQREEEQAARQAAEQTVREREEIEARWAAARAEARRTVQTYIRALLLRSHPSDEDRSETFSECFQACKNSGLDFSSVIQEPIIEDQTPVYWAILNRRTTSSDVDSAAFDALIVALLKACRSFNETTRTSVRAACMLTSDNALLQQLFWQFPPLSPLSMKDGLLLGPSGGGDVIDVEETRDGTGAFIAYIQIRVFRLRMSVSKVVKVEFVTGERIWTASFATSTGPTPESPCESKWLFSLELAHNSSSAYVDADLLISGRSRQSNNSDNDQPVFNVPVGCGGRSLRPGPEHAIRVRLDEGPMRLHWINESSAFTDTDGTLHAELRVRLTHPIVPPVPPLSPDNSDTLSQVSSFPGTQASSIYAEPPPPLPPLPSKTKGKQKVQDPNERVFVSLRKGGNYR
ncbi:hypothetical protein BC827DRAFT_1270940 [Russula dissimulans]|nr:hypothetical protein BC827DRAFT_1270940 [Russula dissimulans]